MSKNVCFAYKNEAKGWIEKEMINIGICTLKNKKNSIYILNRFSFQNTKKAMIISSQTLWELDSFKPHVLEENNTCDWLNFWGWFNQGYMFFFQFTNS